MKIKGEKKLIATTAAAKKSVLREIFTFLFFIVKMMIRNVFSNYYEKQQKEGEVNKELNLCLLPTFIINILLHISGTIKLVRVVEGLVEHANI